MTKLPGQFSLKTFTDKFNIITNSRSDTPLKAQKPSNQQKNKTKKITVHCECGYKN